jgi:formate hydrogenlyase transcriptional activator
VFASATAALRPVVEALEPRVAADRVDPAIAIQSPPLESLESSTRGHILAALEKSGWVIDGPHGAAKILTVHPNTLRSRMKKLGIVRAETDRNRHN